MRLLPRSKRMIENSRYVIMRDVSTMRTHYTENGPDLSEELKKKFREALKGKLAVPECATCPKARSFVPVVEFLIDTITDVTNRMDIAGQRMEEFIEVFNQLEEREMKARMRGDAGL